MILEDDALLSTHTKDILDSLVQQSDYDCVSLETRARKKRVSKKKFHLGLIFIFLNLYRIKAVRLLMFYGQMVQLSLKWIRENGLGLADAILSTGPTWNHGQIEPAAATQLDCCYHYGLPARLKPVQVFTISQSLNLLPCILFCKRRLRGRHGSLLKSLLIIGYQNRSN